MTPARMADIHAAAFAGHGQVWSLADFTAMLARPTTGHVATGHDAFALVQIIAPEAELLTLAVDPPAQGKGLGGLTLDHALRLAEERGAEIVFLEVAEDNAPARSLYDRAGFRETGRRRGYYARGTQACVDAIVMACQLTARKSGKPFKS